jgi:hypothetical protein
MMRLRRKLVAFAALGGAFLLAGCADVPTRRAPIQVFPDMDRQPKYKAQMASDFFGDHRTSRRPVAGTVARGLLREDEGYHTGFVNNMYVGKNPLPVTKETMLRGQQRFNVYCSPCHDRTGKGRGIVAQRSQGWPPTDLHDRRVKGFNDGEIYNIITAGRRSMPAYRFQIPEQDRWAIVTYVRALQRTTSARVEDVPAEERESLQ